jgi:hypothetical protein
MLYFIHTPIFIIFAQVIEKDFDCNKMVSKLCGDLIKVANLRDVIQFKKINRSLNVRRTSYRYLLVKNLMIVC